MIKFILKIKEEESGTINFKCSKLPRPSTPKEEQFARIVSQGINDIYKKLDQISEQQKTIGGTNANINK